MAEFENFETFVLNLLEQHKFLFGEYENTARRPVEIVMKMVMTNKTGFSFISSVFGIPL